MEGPRTRPVVVISKCLGFERCRWNGEIIHDHLVESLKPHLDCRPVCPEVEIGLGVPREPIHIESQRGALKLVQPATGRDVTAEMLSFCDAFLSSLEGVDGFLLKFRSPSCGTGDVKIHAAGGRSGAMAKGAGFFGAAAASRFPHLPVESEGRLKNFRIREHYLTRLFAMSRFRATAAEGSMRALVDFHARHKLLLMAYNQAELKHLGRIVANRDRRPPRELLPLYGEHFARALARAPRYTSNINVLMHTMGYFTNELTPREKAYFLVELERYREGRIPLSAVVSVVNAWIVRFEEGYLEQQAFFRPYPEELAMISDSGKGRDL